jgi:hypothetical protein
VRIGEVLYLQKAKERRRGGVGENRDSHKKHELRRNRIRRLRKER